MCCSKFPLLFNKGSTQLHPGLCMISSDHPPFSTTAPTVPGSSWVGGSKQEEQAGAFRTVLVEDTKESVLVRFGLFIRWHLCALLQAHGARHELQLGGSFVQANSPSIRPLGE